MALSEDNIRCKLKTKHLTKFNPVQLAAELHKTRNLSGAVYNQILKMFEQGIEREELSYILLQNLPTGISVNCVLRTLRSQGYDRLARSLMSVINLKENRICFCGRTVTKPRKAAYIRFRTIKRNIHNHVWPDPASALRTMAKKLRREVDEELDPIKRQINTDILVAHLGAEIDAISIKFDKQFFNDPRFQELLSLVPNSTNALIPKVIFMSRLVNAYAIGGNFVEAERMLSDAMQCSLDLAPCLELVNLYYLDVVFRLWKLEFHPSRELKSTLIDKAKTGLDLLQYENQDIQLYLTRMFFIRMASGLVGVGNRGNVYPRYIIEDGDIMEAKRYLAEVDRLWEGIEIRQKMFYFVVRAKLHHLDGEINIAAMNAQRALALANDGDFREGESIEHYCKELELQIRSHLQGITNDRTYGNSFTSETGSQEMRMSPINVEFTSLESQCVTSHPDEEESSSIITSGPSFNENSPINMSISDVGKSLNFSTFSKESSGVYVNQHSIRCESDVTPLNFSSLFGEGSETSPSECYSSPEKRNLDTTNCMHMVLRLDSTSLQFSSLLDGSSVSDHSVQIFPGANAENDDSAHTSAFNHENAVDRSLPRRTFDVDDVNTIALFEDRCNGDGDSLMENTTSSESSPLYSDDVQFGANDDIQHARVGVPFSDAGNKDFNPDDFNSVVLFEDRDEPEGRSRE